jgi:hypothetical protein
MWCSRLESNQRPPPYQGGALPTELREHGATLASIPEKPDRNPVVLTGTFQTSARCLQSMERETGIEPALVAWKATVLPLNYSRPGVLRFVPQLSRGFPSGLSPGWWREVDSNHRRHEPADLQSAPVGRLGIPPALSNFQNRLQIPLDDVTTAGILPLASSRRARRTTLHGAAYFRAPRCPLSRTVLLFRTTGRGPRPDAPRRGSGRFPARCSCRVP